MSIAYKIITYVCIAVVYMLLFYQIADGDSWFRLERLHKKLKEIETFQRVCDSKGIQIRVKDKDFTVFVYTVKGESIDTCAYYENTYISINDTLVLRMHLLHSMALFNKRMCEYNHNVNANDVTLIIKTAYAEAKKRIDEHYQNEIDKRRKEISLFDD